MNIVELLIKSADKYPQKLALIQGSKKITYKALLENGLSFGARLKKIGIKKGDTVLVFTPLSIALYEAMIGTWCIGASAIFIDFSRGAKFVNDSIERLKPNAVVCDNVTFFAKLAYEKFKTVKTINVMKKQKGSVEIEKLDGEHPAILTLTSGSTGEPKTAVRTHAFLINQYNVLVNHIDFDKDNIDLGTLPVFTLANMAAGLTTLLPYKSYTSKITAKKLAKKIIRTNVTRIICSPALMTELLEFNCLSSLRNIYLGGGPVYPSVLEKIDSSINLFVVYGSTEAEPISSINWREITDLQKQKMSEGKGLPVGMVVDEIECKIIDLNGEFRQADTGEIVVSGDTVLKGYLNGIGDSENKIQVDGKVWHRTGDAGTVDEDGILWLLGRTTSRIEDEQGTIFPFGVECMLNMKFGVFGVVVLLDGKRTIVVEGSDAPQVEIMNELEKMKIIEYISVDKIPKDKRHNAKVDYAELMRTLKEI